MRRIKCPYCDVVLLCREGSNGEEELKNHLNTKYETVIDGLNLFQPFRQLNSCFGKELLKERVV